MNAIRHEDWVAHAHDGRLWLTKWMQSKGLSLSYILTYLATHPK